MGHETRHKFRFQAQAGLAGMACTVDTVHGWLHLSRALRGSAMLVFASSLQLAQCAQFRCFVTTRGPQACTEIKETKAIRGQPAQGRNV